MEGNTQRSWPLLNHCSGVRGDELEMDTEVKTRVVVELTVHEDLEGLCTITYDLVAVYSPLELVADSRRALDLLEFPTMERHWGRDVFGSCLCVEECRFWAPVA